MKWAVRRSAEKVRAYSTVELAQTDRDFHSRLNLDK